MSLLHTLHRWLRRPAPRRAARRPLLEALEDRCVLSAAPPPAIAVFQPNSGTWYVRSSPSPGAPSVAPFNYGGPGWVPVSGDFDGTGTPTVGVVQPGTMTWYLSGSTGPFRYGAPGWVPLVGDWTGTGHAGIGAFDPKTATFYLRNEDGPGAPDAGVIHYGGTGWFPVVGDWDGNGTTTIGVVNPWNETWYLKNANAQGTPDIAPFAYGGTFWAPVVSDWDGNGTTTIGVVNPWNETWYLKNTNAAGAPDLAPFRYGAPGWTPLAFSRNANPVAPGGTGGSGSPSGSSAGAAGSGVVVQVPATVVGSDFTVTVTLPAGDPGTASASSVFVDVDLDHNGDFSGQGETDYASALPVPSADGSTSTATIDVHGLAPGTYSLRVHNDDAASSVFSRTATVTVQAPPADHLPVSFEANKGQTDQQVQFLARERDATVYLTPGGGFVVSAIAQSPTPAPSLGTGTAGSAGGASPPAGDSSSTDPPLYQFNQWVNLLGADTTAGGAGEDPLPGKTNYLLGDDPTQWHTGIPNYQGVTYHNVYPGIDAHYGDTGGQLETEFVVAPGADPTRIQMQFAYSQGVSVDADGRLVVQTAGGPLTESAPVVYQQVNGVNRTIPSQYFVSGSIVTFEIGTYDTTKPLIIDPTLSYSTYLGGTQSDSANANALFVDGAGNAYVAGYTNSTDFPTTAGVVQAANAGQRDAFVTKIDPTGATKLYSTYLGGKKDEDPPAGANNLANTAIAVDSGGNAYVAGSTQSTDFPTTAGVLQPKNAGGVDVFVAKLDPNGASLVYSTYLGGAQNDGERGVGIALDAGGDAFVTGDTGSNKFPVTAGVVQNTLKGQRDAFVTELNSGATAAVYSTYLGGAQTDEGNGIAVDGAGNAFVTGQTSSNNFPTTGGVVQGARGGGSDAFVTELSPAGTSLVYSTYLGGPGNDSGQRIAVDSSGDAYVGGSASAGFPTSGGVFQGTYGGGATDGFIAKLSPGGTSRLFSTYVGGSGADSVRGLTVDSSGNVYVTGQTSSPNLKTASPVQGKLNGPTDAFVTVLNSTGTTEIFGTYLGGSGNDSGGGIALDGSNNIYVAGQTTSTDFPTTAGVFQANNAGMQDAFVSKLTAVVAPSAAGFCMGPNPPDDIFDQQAANDTSDVATDMGTLSTTPQTFNNLSINLKSNGYFDQDWYKWSVPRNGSWTVTLNNIMAGTCDIQERLFVLQSDGTLLELGNSTRTGGVTTQTATVSVSGGTEVYAWVYGFNFATGTYGMTVNFS